MGLKDKRPDGTYVSILGSDGTLRVASEKGADGAVERTYEDKEKVEHTKYELVYTEISGHISGISFKDGKFGRSINVSIGDGDDKFILSINTESNFGESFMKQLPNIDLKKDITLSPYSFEDDNGKNRRGVSIKQDDVKIENFFYDKKKEENINDFPNINEDKKPKPTENVKWKKFWRAYFSDVEDFLVEYTEEKIIPKLEKKSEIANGDSSKEVKEEADPLDDDMEKDALDNF